MTQPVFVIPEAMTAMMGFARSADNRGVPKSTFALVHQRVSQINGCAFCLDLHTNPEYFAKDTDHRTYAVAAWRDA
ncbi:MAG TPA: carboxymuconolactone decarboxylase family protein, partial [Acidimicrobiia bacterium]